MISNNSVRMRGVRMMMVEAVNKFILGGRNVRKWNPGIFRFRKIFPVNEIFKMVTDLVSIMDGLNGESRIVSEAKRFRQRMRLESGRIVVGLEKSDIKDRVKMREVRREVEKIS